MAGGAAAVSPEPAAPGERRAAGAPAHRGAPDRAATELAGLSGDGAARRPLPGAGTDLGAGPGADRRAGRPDDEPRRPDLPRAARPTGRHRAPPRRRRREDDRAGRGAAGPAAQA